MGCNDRDVRSVTDITKMHIQAVTTLKVSKDLQRSRRFMKSLRAESTDRDLQAHQVTAVRDYKADTIKDLTDRRSEANRTSELQCLVLMN